MRRVRGLRAVPVAFLLAGVAYLGLRLAAFVPASTRAFPDSGSYLHVAAESLISTEFFAGSRGWTVPLLYKLLPDSDSARSIGQLAISIGCWVALAAVVARCVRSRTFRLPAFCMVLLFSLSVWIAQWDRAILSESLAVSLTAALFAAWLAVASTPTRGSWWAIAAVLGITLLWAFARDTNPYVVLLLVPLVLVWAAFRGDRGPPIVLASGLIAIFIFHAAALDSPGGEIRRERQLLNVVGTRVLADESELRYFQDRGMPVPARLRALTGLELGHSETLPMLEDSHFAPFREWVRDDAHSTLVRYLLTHPDYALEPAFRHPEQLFTPDPRPEPHAKPLVHYRPQGADPLLPAPLAAVVFPPPVAALLAWLGAVVAVAAWLAWRGHARIVWLVPAIALLLQVPHAAIVWHGDSLEVPRHALLVGVMTRLSLLLLTIFLIDAALGRRGQEARLNTATNRLPPGTSRGTPRARARG